MDQNQIKFSVVIPVFNESRIIGQVISDLAAFLEREMQSNYEIIAVDDGSSDGSVEVLRGIQVPNFRFISHFSNKGYGASLKAGAKEARGEWLVFYDGDGQHTPEELKKLMAAMDGSEMIVGARQKYEGPRWRQPGKKFISILANYLVKSKIPDLNSGLRIVKKEYFGRFSHLYPKGFSLSTTITLAFFKEGYSVKYTPINVRRRVGKSSVRIADGFNTINLVVRMVMLFAPLRIFIPVFCLLFVLAALSLGIDIFVYTWNLSDTTVLLFVSAGLILFLGLVADQIASLRREIKL